MEEGDSTEVFFDTGGTFDYPPDSVDSNVLTGQYQLTVKQEMLRELLSRNGALLEVSSWNGMPTTKCRFRLRNIEFEAGQWYRSCNYTFSVETDELICSLPGLSTSEDVVTADSGNVDVEDGYDIVKNYNVTECSDSLSIDLDVDIYGIFKVSHNVSAKGIRMWDSVGNPSGAAWEHARSFVQDRMGYNPTIMQSSAFGNISGQFQHYNHYVTESIDKFEGRYSVTESWVLASSNFYEDYSAEVRQSVNDPYKTITVNGTINGLSDFQVGIDPWEAESTFLKYNAASGAWALIQGDLYTRAQSQIGIALNPLPVTQLVTHNFIKGNIGYNYEFNTRSQPFVSGAISEVWSIQDSNISGLAEVIASHVILNRARGPLLQQINTPQRTSRAVNYECVVSGLSYPSGNNIAAVMALNPRNQVHQLLSSIVPTNYVPGYLFVTTDNDDWSPTSLRYTKNFVWEYERAI